MTVDMSPLGNSAPEAAAFVRAQIQSSLPSGWCVTGLDESGYLHGQITPIGADPWYEVMIPTGLDLLIFTWGNGGPGPMGPENVMERALIVAPMFLRMYGMTACITRLLEFPANSYGLT
jgi:hypothetical protein